MENSFYIACICEGGAEKAIINILLDNNKLIFERNDLVGGELIDERNAQTFTYKYLTKIYDKKINIIRILDSHKENFTIKGINKYKINKIYNIVTVPEIEILIIYNENLYDEYKKTKLKPSQYCIQKLKYKNVKSKEFIYQYFSDVSVLIDVIKKYCVKHPKKHNEYQLIDILNS